MTTPPGNASSNLPGKPPVADMATWHAARNELLVREKAHTREGDAIAAARQRLPVVELDGTVEVTGPDRPVPFGDVFQGRDELVVYKHMWYRTRHYSTTGRGNKPVDGSLGLLDMTPYGRREAWQDNPEGWPEAPRAGSPVGGRGSPICWYWRSDDVGNATWGPTSRPVPQWTCPGAAPVQTLGRHGEHHWGKAGQAHETRGARQCENCWLTSSPPSTATRRRRAGPAGGASRDPSTSPGSRSNPRSRT